MYPIRINLLSEIKKENLNKVRNFQFIKSIFELVLLLLTIVAIFLLLSQWILQNYFNALTQNVVDVSSEKIKEIKIISQINELVENTNELQKKYNEIVPILIALADESLNGIIYYSLNVKLSENKIIINGKANERQNFINFRKKLENIYFVKTVFSPLSDLTKQDNIDFSITLEL